MVNTSIKKATASLDAIQTAITSDDDLGGEAASTLQCRLGHTWSLTSAATFLTGRQSFEALGPKVVEMSIEERRQSVLLFAMAHLHSVRHWTAPTSATRSASSTAPHAPKRRHTPYRSTRYPHRS